MVHSTLPEPDWLAQVNVELESAEPGDILLWAWERFRPLIALTSSFQTQSVPLLHMVSHVTPMMPVLFLDTGYHFPETLAFRDHLVKLLDLRLRNLTPDHSGSTGGERAGTEYRTNPDLCCYIRKVEPLEAALKELKAWVTGIRRDQTKERQDVAIVSDRSDGLVKICPLARWTRNDVEDYLRRHGLPHHPLKSHGYASVGCSPCTRPVLHGEDERSGRWPELKKTECGLHLGGKHGDS